MTLTPEQQLVLDRLTPERTQQLLALVGRMEENERKVHQSFSDDDHEQYFLTNASRKITGKTIVEVTDTEALLIRKYRDGGDVFTVDTDTPSVRIDANVGINIASSDDAINLWYAPADDASAHGIFIAYRPDTTSTSANYGAGHYADVRPNISSGVTNSGYVRGILSSTLGYSGLLDGTLTNLSGAYIQFGNYSGAGTITSAHGLRIKPFHRSGTITTSYGIRIEAPTTGGTVTNEWAIHVADDAPNYFAGNVLIGDTANTDMTLGLTINQGAHDDQILAFKSSDVAHGMTGLDETDTYCRFSKFASTDGGLFIRAFTEAAQAVYIVGACTTGNTDKNATATAPISLDARQKSGTGTTDMDANTNLFVIRENASTRFLVDEDGDYYYDGTGVGYDAYNDISLVRAFTKTVTPEGTIQSKWDEYVEHKEKDLVELGILGDTIENGGLVNGSQLQRLHNGAIWQLAEKYYEMEQRLNLYGEALLEAGIELPKLSS